VPHFYIAAAAAARARALDARTIAVTNRVTFDGVPAARIEVPTPADTPPLRDRLADAGVPCYEADVRFGLRYLIDHRVRGAVAIGGAGRPVPELGRVFDDPPDRSLSKSAALPAAPPPPPRSRRRRTARPPAPRARA
jgi:hypothetical protein